MARTRRVGAARVAVLLAAALSVIGPASPAAAATFTWTVDSLGDQADASAGNGTCATATGTCTLRAALQEANAHPGDTNRIHFSVAGTIQTGATAPDLPWITANGTVIDGTTAPGYAVGAPTVTVRGTAYRPDGWSAFDIQGDDVTVKGLRVGNFLKAVRVQSMASGARIEGNQFGSSGGGYDANLALAVGVTVYGPGAVIGGPGAGQGNLMAGFLVKGVNAAATATDLVVEGNRFGTNAAGTAAAKHPDATAQFVLEGVTTLNAAFDSASPSATFRNNQVAGHGGYGVWLYGQGQTTVQGNLIGTTATGASPLGATGFGILVQGQAKAQIGGTTPSLANVIAGTVAGPGSAYESAQAIRVLGGAEVTIEGNWIGTNASGAAGLTNAGGGILVRDPSTKATIGGTASGAGNVIVTPNNGTGISTIGGTFTGSQTNEVVIQGNKIGTNPAGTAKLGSTGTGIAIWCATKATIGGTAAGAGNVVAGVTGNGITVCDSKLGTVIQGNAIGTNAAGTGAITAGEVTGNAVDNGNTGISITKAGGTPIGSTRLLIGGTAAGAGNLISGNTDRGVEVFDVDAIVAGNKIGTNLAGTAAIPNESDGIWAHGAAMTIGGTAAGAGNLVSGNGGSGIWVDDAAGTVVHGNRIGTDAAGTGAIGNAFQGVTVTSTDGATIGGVGAGEANLIVHQGGGGVLPIAPSKNIVIRGNRIHTNTRMTIDLYMDASGSLANDDQPFPVMTATVGAQTSVSGTVRSDQAATVLIDVYAANVCGPDGSGEAKEHLGTVSFAHPGGGAAQPFAGTVALPSSGNTTITATATVPGNGTSQLSTCAPYSDLKVEAVANATKAPVGDEVATLFTVTNRGPAAATGVVLDVDPTLGPTWGADTWAADGPSKGAVDVPSKKWTVGTLAVGESITLCVRQAFERETVENPLFPGIPFTATLGANVFSDTGFEHNDPIRGNDFDGVAFSPGPRVDAADVCALPTVSVGDAQVVRPTTGTTNLVFPVTLANSQSRPVSVKYATQNGTAASVIDYVATSGTLTIPAGQKTGQIVVPVVGNQSDEPDKAFSLLLSSPTHLRIGDGTATGTIQANQALGGCPPNPTKNQAFVCHLYYDALNRAAEPGGFSYWVRRLDGGDSRANMAKAYLTQPESRRVLVDRIFVFYLARHGSASELTTWSDRLAARSTTPEKIRTTLLASAEYYAKAGGTGASWVTSVYRDVFRRSPDSGGQAYWLGKLAGGQSRTQVATGMLTQNEGRRRVIDDIFLRFVRRYPPQSESAPWVEQMKAGKTEADIAISVVASSEYFNRP